MCWIPPDEGSNGDTVTSLIFSSLFTVFVNRIHCTGGWVLLLLLKFRGKSTFFSTSLMFFVYKRGSVPGYLGGFGLICRNSQRGCLPGAHLSLGSFSFPMLPPPSSALSAGCSLSLGCSFQGHRLLLWQLKARVKRTYGFSFRFAVRVWTYLLTCITVDRHGHPQHC